MRGCFSLHKKLLAIFTGYEKSGILQCRMSYMTGNTPALYS